MIVCSTSDPIYRGLRIDTQEWVYGYLIARKGKYYIATSDALDFMVISNKKATLNLIEVQPDTVGIYTFKNDRNDTKIFTGDILETTLRPPSPFSNEFRILVLFDEELSMFYADGFCEVDTYEFRYCRIVGNIYENPELTDTIPLDT